MDKNTARQLKIKTATLKRYLKHISQTFDLKLNFLELPKITLHILMKPSNTKINWRN